MQKDSGLKDNQHALPSLCDAIADDECLNWASELENLVKSKLSPLFSVEIIVTVLHFLVYNLKPTIKRVWDFRSDLP